MTALEAIDSDEHYSLQQQGINYDRKKFCDECHWSGPSHKCDSTCKNLIFQKLSFIS